MKIRERSKASMLFGIVAIVASKWSTAKDGKSDGGEEITVAEGLDLIEEIKNFMFEDPPH
jgi:hypothetical protein